MTWRRIHGEANDLAVLLGKNIVLRRTQLGISQKYLAVRLGITPESLACMERGVIAPRVSRIADIAFELRCTPAWLFQAHHDERIELESNVDMLVEHYNFLPGDIQERRATYRHSRCKAHHVRGNAGVSPFISAPLPRGPFQTPALRPRSCAPRRKARVRCAS